MKVTTPHKDETTTTQSPLSAFGQLAARTRPFRKEHAKQAERLRTNLRRRRSAGLELTAAVKFCVLVERP